MSSLSTGALAVSCASLYFEVRGAGPALLIVPTGNGDATPFGPLADMLADRYTVVTYDRRGFSRSPVDGPVNDARRIETDVADCLRLIDHVGAGPAHVLGGSSGAIVVLTLLERHADRIRKAVVHEPPLASVLPDRDRWLKFYAQLHRTYLKAGPAEAMALFRAEMGMSESTRPPAEYELPQPALGEMLERLRRNQLFWFEHEVLPYPAALPDFAALKTVADQLVLGCGTTSRDTFPYRPNLVLAEQLGVEVTHFPGGHVGYVTHPVEFAAQLMDVLG